MKEDDPLEELTRREIMLNGVSKPGYVGSSGTHGDHEGDVGRPQVYFSHPRNMS
jgi:hypothetical protein